MTALPAAIREKLIQNGNHFQSNRHQINNVPPVCRITTRTGFFTCLLTEISADNPDIGWGLVQWRDQLPDFELVSIKMIEGVLDENADEETPPADCRITAGWKATRPISEYIAAAHDAGFIVDIEDQVSGIPIHPITLYHLGSRAVLRAAQTVAAWCGHHPFWLIPHQSWKALPAHEPYRP